MVEVFEAHPDRKLVLPPMALRHLVPTGLRVLHILTRLLGRGHCGASCQLETSGKRTDRNLYRYYKCRRATRIGVDADLGFRIAADTLDHAVLDALAGYLCRSALGGDLQPQEVRFLAPPPSSGRRF